MIKKVSMIKCNNEYFGHNDLVIVKKIDGEIIIGKIIIGYDGCGEPHVTTSNKLYLDASEKYHSQKIGIRFKEINSIKKID